MGIEILPIIFYGLGIIYYATLMIVKGGKYFVAKIKKHREIKQITEKKSRSNEKKGLLEALKKFLEEWDHFGWVTPESFRYYKINIYDRQTSNQPSLTALLEDIYHKAMLNLALFNQLKQGERLTEFINYEDSLRDFEKWVNIKKEEVNIMLSNIDSEQNRAELN